MATVLAIVLATGCAGQSNLGAIEPTVFTTAATSPPSTAASTLPPTTSTPTTNESIAITATTSNVPEPTSRPPKIKAGSAREPTQLPVLGLDVWLVEDWDEPDYVVRTDDSGMIVETLWQEDIASVGASTSGHTLLCYDTNDDGTVDLVDLRFRFAGDLSDTYQESRTVAGAVISETEIPVDGTNVPTEIFQTCGVGALGPYFRVTSLQWGAALLRAGFTDIAGDHAIDPVWEAIATWKGVEYSPLNLFQGEFRPEPTDETELLECELGAIQLPTALPADARSSLESVAKC